MAIQLEAFTVTVGNPLGFGWGYSADFGTGDSISPTTWDVFGGSTIRGLWWINNVLRLEVWGAHEPTQPWDYLVVGGSSYYLSSYASFDIFQTSLGNSLSPYTVITWSSSTNPFGTTNGTNISCKFQSSGFVPLKDSISLNQIHTEAGGTSGTSVTINDADVRGKSWYARVAGSTPASGATQKLTDFYEPTTIIDHEFNFVSGTPTNFPVRRVANGYTGGSSGDAAQVTSQVAYVASSTTNMDAFQGMSVQTNGTDSGIYIHCGSTYGAGLVLKKIYCNGTTQNNFTTGPAIIFKNAVITAAALESTVYTSTIDSTYGSGPTVQNLGFTSGITTSYMSTNSATSFTNLTTNTYHGRGYKISLGPIGQYTYGYWDSWCRVRYSWRIRIAPTSSRCYLDKGQYTLNFVVYSSNYVYHVDPSDPNLPDPGPGGQ